MLNFYRLEQYIEAQMKGDDGATLEQGGYLTFKRVQKSLESSEQLTGNRR